MKIKIKIISLLLITAIACLCLSSCYLLDLDLIGSTSGANQDVTINTGDVNNFDVNISTTDDPEAIATSAALLSSVSIRAKFRRTNTGSYPGTSTSGNYSLGSGVIFKLSEDKSVAYILTNYHVVYSSGISTDITVYLYGMEDYLYSEEELGNGIKASYLGGSMAYDLAVLKVENSPVLMESNATACKFADSDKVLIMEPAIAIGNAAGKGISATMGRVNVDSENITMLGPDDKTQISLRVMRTDAAVNSGNSGGGLFNSRGELIGIVNAKIVDSKVDNIGYAIPANVAGLIAKNIIDYCDGDSALTSVYKCMLGIYVEAVDLYTVYDTETGALMRCERVAIESFAEKNYVDGVFKVGDVINSISLNDEVCNVTRTFHVIDFMLGARVDDTVVFNITRGAETFDVSVKLTSEMLTKVN